MSGTQYSRDRSLRMTGDEQALLAELVMREIETLSRARAELDAVGVDIKGARGMLRDLRSLLERLSQ